MLNYLTKHSRLVLLAIALLGLWAYGCENRRAGRLQEEKAGLERRNAQLEDQTGRIDTVYSVDTVRRSHTYVRTDSILRTDTLWRTDTVRALLAAERNACSAVVQSCDTRVALRDQRIAVLDSLNHVLAKQKPGFVKRRFGCAAGVGATTSGAGLGAACGVKFP